MNFVAIDFETATSGISSICSMGICTVQNGKISEQREILIKPDPFEFNDFNIKIHGITPDDVAAEPTFDKLWKEIFPYLNDRFIIAHNASFDIGALVAVMNKYSLPFPNFRYLCTVKLSQKAFPDLPHHKLNNMAEALGISFLHHHAAEDAYVCAMIMLRIMEKFGLRSVEDIENRFNIGIGHIYPNCHIPCTKNKRTKKSAIPNENDFLQLK